METYFPSLKMFLTTKAVEDFRYMRLVSFFEFYEKNTTDDQNFDFLPLYDVERIIAVILTSEGVCDGKSLCLLVQRIKIPLNMKAEKFIKCIINWMIIIYRDLERQDLIEELLFEDVGYSSFHDELFNILLPSGDDSTLIVKMYSQQTFRFKV